MTANLPRIAFSIAVVFAVALASAQPRPPAIPELASANTAFGFRLFSELVKQDPKGNTFISPTSVSMALSMAYNGSAGKTRTAMAQTLGVGGMPPELVNQASSALRQELLAADPKVKLTIANSLWARKGIAFVPSFMQAVEKSYAAKVTSLDFTSSSAPTTINGWVSDNTSGRIKEIVSRIDPGDVLFIINAIYFKGTWTKQFDKALTHEQDFHKLDGSKVRRPMMARNDKFRYLAGKGFQAISLPYGGGRMSMYVFLPEEKAGLPGLLAQLGPDNWQKWLGGFKEMEGEVALPRFRLEYSASLNGPLKAMGMAEAFAPGKADFMKMVKGPQPVYISDVLHKTFVEVNEEGTEAAAVTSIRVAMTAIPATREKFSFIADHPFFCAIVDDRTGSLLFMGTIVEPK